MASHLNLEYFGILAVHGQVDDFEVHGSSVDLCAPNVVLCIMAKHLHFGLVHPKNIIPKFLLFVQMQLYKLVVMLSCSFEREEAVELFP